jgi:malonyl-CoA O-methyltransferase
MNMPIGKDKTQFAKRFGDAAAAYDEHALVQAQVVEALIDWVGLSSLYADTALDIGCGTCDISRHYFGQACTSPKANAQNSQGPIWLNLDIAIGMLKTARLQQSACITDSQHNKAKQHYLCGDAEALPLADESMDLLCSSMALQWCDNVDLVLAEMYRVLKPKGRACLALMVAPSFSVLNDAWASIGMASRVNTFNHAPQWLLAASGFDWQVRSEQRCFYTEHVGLMQMLKSIKGVGANIRTHKQSKASFSKSELAKLNGYFAEQPMLYLDYEVLFIELTK